MLLSLRQSSSRNSARTDEEFSFLHAVEFSDVSSVRRLLGENPNLNVDVIDVLGRSALRLAVRNENRELVEMLLELCNSENIQQSLLQAISENHTTVAELILRHPSYLQICRRRKYLGDTDGFFKMEVESQFSTDITPLNLAAQKNNFPIVQLLLTRGESIIKPDRFDCGCTECLNRMKFDQLRLANFRLNSYRGLASEAYIALSSDDPFLTAFELANELKKVSCEEQYFKKEYKDLANKLSQFMVDLLERVWTQQELEVVLNKKGTSADTDRYENLARLNMALENREKQFVAHPSVQQHLVKLWHRGLPHYDSMPSWGRLPYIAGLTLAYPAMAIANFIHPGWKWSKLAVQPMVKFIGHTLSYFLFLTLIIISSWEETVSNRISLESQCPGIFNEYQQYREVLGAEAVPYGTNFPLRPHEPTVTSCFLTLWLAGMVVQEIQQITYAGLRGHFSELFNVMDFFLLVAYLAVIVLDNWLQGMVIGARDALSGRNVSLLLKTRHETDLHLYWLNADRQNWRELDPNNVSEGLFALANIVSFVRILHLLPANEMLGPMQISLRRTINDVIKILSFGALAVAGFIISLRNLFWWYSGTVAISKDPADRKATNAATSFLDIRSQFITVFWWIYGRGPMNEALDIPKKYKGGAFTQTVGHLLAAMYHITVIIVLVNLFIAMMARSFEKIVDDVDSEWKFARSLLYMEYIDENCAPPVPLNLLTPVRDVILACINYIRHRREKKDPPLSALVGRERRKACYSASNLLSETGSGRQGRLTASSSDDQPSYKDITQMIVRRYIFDIQREEEINTGKLEEARQNICHLKWELLDLMDEREGKGVYLNTCMRAITSELSTLLPPNPSSSSSSSATRRNQQQASVCVRGGHVEGGDGVRKGEGEKEGGGGGIPEYPKTNVIVSASGL
ncbi:hypothetical protein ACOMHN_045247 [Nucella lapillus]